MALARLAKREDQNSFRSRDKNAAVCSRGKQFFRGYQPRRAPLANAALNPAALHPPLSQVTRGDLPF